MTSDPIKRLDELTASIKADTQTLHTLWKAQKAAMALCLLPLLAAVALSLAGARTAVLMGLSVLGLLGGLATALVGRRIAAVRRRAEGSREELSGLIAAMERDEKAPRIPLVLGFANLSGADLDPLVAEDAQALAPLFSRTRVVAHHQIPSAEVLFVYAHLNADGTLQGPKPAGLRQIVQATHAAIVVLASPNPAESIHKAVVLPGPRSANLVFTLDRNAGGFARFFKELFEKMQTGQDMLSAWAEIAPQHPGANPDYAPQTVLLAEGGRIAFPPP